MYVYTVGAYSEVPPRSLGCGKTQLKQQREAERERERERDAKKSNHGGGNAQADEFTSYITQSST